MNLLAKRIGTGILGMLVLFISCEDPSDIGLILTPDDQTGLFFKELPVDVSTTLIGNIDTETTGGFSAIVGAFNDPDFGNFSSRFNGQFIPERLRVNDADTIADPDATFISATLKLQAPYFRSVQFGEDQTFRVFRLFEDLDFENRYISSDTISLINPATMMANKIGEHTFSYDPAQDTANLLSLDIPLTDSFGLDLLASLQALTEPTYDSAAAFWEVYKGLSIVPDDNNNAIFGFFLRSTSNRIEVSWSEERPSGDSTIIDTLTFEYPFYASETQLVTGFNSYTVDRTGTLLENLDFHEDLTNDNGMAFLQAGTGVCMRLNLDSVFSFLDTIEFVQINRAELVIENIEEYQGNEFEFNGPSFLQYFYSDSTNLFVTDLDSIQYTDDITEGLILPANDFLVPEPGIPGGQALGVLENDTDSYSTILTLNLQIFEDNPDGSTFDQDYLLVPEAYRDDFSRFIANKEDIRFRIYYTTLRE